MDAKKLKTFITGFIAFLHFVGIVALTHINVAGEPFYTTVWGKIINVSAFVAFVVFALVKFRKNK